jgi:hypothetical protein
MKGTRILLEPEGKARGKIEECYISGTPYPGTIMQLKSATEPKGGLFTYEAYDRTADGNRPQGPHAVLLEKDPEGKTYADIYADGDLGKVYIPLPGDEMNLLVSAAGTGEDDAQAIGALYIVDDGTGYLVATTGSPECEPFVCRETATDVVATGTLLRCQYTGH